MPYIPPRVRPDSQATPGFAAPQVAPIRDASGAQMEEFGKALQIAGLSALNVADYRNDVTAGALFNDYEEQVSKRESAYGLMQGKEAMDALPQVQQSMVDLRQKFEGSIEDSAVLAMFNRRADIRDSDSRVRVGAHGAQQTKVAKIGTLEASSESELRNYQKTYEFALTVDPSFRPEMLAIADAQRRSGLLMKQQAGQLRGETKEMTANKLAEATDEMHLQLIGAIVDQNPTEARAYFEKHKDEMSAASAARAARGIHNASVADTSLKFMFQAEAQAAAKGGSMLQQQDYALATADASYRGGKLTAEEYDAAVSRLEHRYRLNRSEEAQRVVDVYNSAEAFLAKPENLALGPDALDANTKTVLQNNGKWNNIVSFAKNGRVVNDEVLYAQAISMTAEDHNQLEDSEFVDRLQGHLAPTVIEQLVKRRHAIQGKSMGGDYTSITHKNIEDSAARELGVLPKDLKQSPTSEELTAMEQQRLEFQDAKLREEAIKGHKLSDKEYKELLDTRVIAEKKQTVLVRNDSLWNAINVGYSLPFSTPEVERPVSELTPGELANSTVVVGLTPVKVGDIPPWFVRDATAFFHSQGEPATFSAIADQWVAQKKPTAEPARTPIRLGRLR